MIVDETMHVAGKATGVRAYVDYDSTSGLPAITTLSGELIVTSGGAQTTLQPIANITPQRATEINRGSVGHTLNFLIPGPWCDGDIDIRLRVFDASIPSQKSGALHRTLRFVRVNPLRVYAVGINYTGAGLKPGPSRRSRFRHHLRLHPPGLADRRPAVLGLHDPRVLREPCRNQGAPAPRSSR